MLVARARFPRALVAPHGDPVTLEWAPRRTLWAGRLAVRAAEMGVWEFGTATLTVWGADSQLRARLLSSAAESRCRGGGRCRLGREWLWGGRGGWASAPRGALGQRTGGEQREAGEGALVPRVPGRQLARRGPAVVFLLGVLARPGPCLPFGNDLESGTGVPVTTLTTAAAPAAPGGLSLTHRVPFLRSPACHCRPSRSRPRRWQPACSVLSEPETPERSRRTPACRAGRPLRGPPFCAAVWPRCWPFAPHTGRQVWPFGPRFCAMGS